MRKTFYRIGYRVQRHFINTSFIILKESKGNTFYVYTITQSINKVDMYLNVCVWVWVWSRSRSRSRVWWELYSGSCTQTFM